MEQWFDRLTTPRKIEGRFDCGFDGEPSARARAEWLSRTAHRPEQFGPELTAEGPVEG
jgi:hypothetical protein